MADFTPSNPYTNSGYTPEQMAILARYGVYSEAEAKAGNWVVLGQYAYTIVDVGSGLTHTPASTLNRVNHGLDTQMLSAANRLIPIPYGYVHVGGRIYEPVYNGQNIVILAVWGLGPIWGVAQVLANGLTLPANATVRSYPGMARSRLQSCTITGSNTITGNLNFFAGVHVGAYIKFANFANTANNQTLRVTGIGSNKEYITVAEALVNETATVYWKQPTDPTVAALFGSGFADDLCSPSDVSPAWACAYSVIEIPYGSISGFPQISAYIYGRMVKQLNLCYIELNGSTQYLSTPNSSSNQFNEDFEVIAHVAADDWTPASEKTLVGKWDGPSNGGWDFTLSTAGQLILYVSTNGSSSITYTSSATLSSLANGTRKFVRVRFTKSNGANSTAEFATSDDGQRWTALGSTQIGAIVSTIFASTASLRIGTDDDLFGPWDGKIYGAWVRSATRTACAFQIFDYEPYEVAFTDEAGVAWTLNGGAIIGGDTYGVSTVPIDQLCHLAVDRTSGPGRKIDQGTAMYTRELNVMQVGTVPENLCDAHPLIIEQADTDTWIDVLRDYAHCFAILEGDRYYFVRNWDDSAVASFDNTNMIERSFQLRTLGTQNAPTVVEVVYTDRNTTPWKAEPAPIYRDGVKSGTLVRRMSRVQRLGTARFSEAKRIATERVNDAYYNNSVVTFTTDDLGLLTRPGDAITVSYPYEAGNSANRLNQVRYLVTSITPSSPGRWQITARRHDSRRFSSEVASQPPGPISDTPTPASPPAVTAVTPSENLYQLADGTWSSQIRVQWTHDVYPFVANYVIEIYEGGVDPANLRHSGISYTTNYVTPPLKEKVSYTIKVWIRSTAMVDGTAGSATFTPDGKFIAPSWPASASLSGFEVGGKVILYWPKAIDIDTLRYELRYKKTSESPTWDSATTITTIDALTFAHEGVQAGTYTWYVKGIDTVGLETPELSVNITVTSDLGSFQTLTFKPTTWSLLAATEFLGSDGKRYAVTDWADPKNYGHSTQDDANAAGDWDDGSVPGSTVMTQPHSSAPLFDGNTYAPITYAAGLAHSASNYAVDAWIFPTDITTEQCIYSERGTTDAAGFSIHIGPGSGGGSGTGRFYLRAHGGTMILESNNGVIPLRQWTHVCVIVWTTGQWLVVNGEILTSFASNPFPGGYGSWATSTQNRVIGHYLANSASSTGTFRGIISRVRLWNDWLNDAAEVKRCMQYPGTQVTTIINSGQLVAAKLAESWLLSDYTQGVLTNTAAGQKGVANATFPGSISGGAVQWRSWDQVESNVIDLGQQYAGLFEIINGPTSLSGTVRTVMLLSNDNVTFTEFVGGQQRASGRYVKFRMQAEGGSALYNLTDAAVAIGLSPREETFTVTTVAGLTGGDPTPYVVTLAGDYSQSMVIELTPKFNSAGARLPDYDQIEVSFGRAMPTGRGLRFAGVAGSAAGCYVNLGDFTTFEFGTGAVDNPFSIEFWVKPDSIGTIQQILGKGSGLPDGEWIVRLNAQGKVEIYLLDISASASIQMYSATNLQAGVWYHVAITYDGNEAAPTTGLKMYINGNVEAVGYGGSGSYVAMEATAIPLVFGAGYWAGTYQQPFAGVLDEVRLWNDVRTQVEIQTYLQSSVPSNEGGLVGYWKLDETSGYSASDSQTNVSAHNGTLGTGSVFNNRGSGANTQKWWRPPDGFDVYCRDTSNAYVANEVKVHWKGM